MKLDYEPIDPAADRPQPYAWAVVGLLFVVALLNYLDRNAISTMRDPIRADLHVSDAMFGLFSSVFLWTYAACSPLGGYMADRFGRRRVILTSLLFWSAATVASGYAHTSTQMLIARILMGVSEACYIPAALSLISDYHRGPTRSLATGVHMIGLYVGSAIGGVGGTVADHWGWRTGFHVFGGVGIAYFFILAFSLFDAPKPATSRDTAMRIEDQPPSTAGFGTIAGTLFTTGGFYILALVNILIGTVNWTANTWMPTFIKEQFHLTNGAAGLWSTLPVQIASLCGVLAAGAISDRWSRANPRARAIVPAFGWLLAGPFVILIASTSNLYLAAAGLAVFGIGRGAFDANQMPIVRQLVDERFSATTYGFLNFIGTAVGGGMAYIGGWLKDHHPDAFTTMFQGCGVCLMVVGTLLFFLRLHRRSISDQENDLETVQSASLSGTAIAAEPD